MAAERPSLASPDSQWKVKELAPGELPEEVTGIKGAMELDMGGRSSKEVCLETDTDPGLLSRYLSKSLNATPSVLKLIIWTRRIGPNLLLYIAERCGFDLVRKREAPGGDAPVISSVARVAAQAGATLSACLEALADGVIDEHERQSIHAITGQLLLEVQTLHEATAEQGA